MHVIGKDIDRQSKDKLQEFRKVRQQLHTSEAIESPLELSLDSLDKQRLMSPYVNMPSRKSSPLTTRTQFCWPSFMDSIASFKVTVSATFTNSFDIALET